MIPATAILAAEVPGPQENEMTLASLLEAGSNLSQGFVSLLPMPPHETAVHVLSTREPKEERRYSFRFQSELKYLKG